QELVVLNGHIVRVPRLVRVRVARVRPHAGDADAAAVTGGRDVGLTRVAQHGCLPAEHQTGVVVADGNRAAGVLSGIALQRVPGDDQVPHRRVGPDRATRSGVALVSARA